MSSTMVQEGVALTNFHRDVRAYLDDTTRDRWLGRKRPNEYPASSPNFPPLAFYLWGTLINTIYSKNAGTL
ncbi:hypothetical protein C0J52_26890 [Blattella germanica]|nr:hypothetical protein C0J52_26890 [Blattella germanica]